MGPARKLIGIALLLALGAAQKAAAERRCEAECVNDCPRGQSCIRVGPERCECLPDVPTESLWDLGTLTAGRTYPTQVTAQNVSCPGRQTISIAVEGAPWFRITGPDALKVRRGDSETTPAVVDLRGLEAGERRGRITFTCTTCPPSCNQDLQRLELRLVVVAANPPSGEPPRQPFESPSELGCPSHLIVNTCDTGIKAARQSCLQDVVDACSTGERFEECVRERLASHLDPAEMQRLEGCLGKPPHLPDGTQFIIGEDFGRNLQLHHQVTVDTSRIQGPFQGTPLSFGLDEGFYDLEFKEGGNQRAEWKIVDYHVRTADVGFANTAFGRADFYLDKDRPSTGTIDLRTGASEGVQHLLMESEFLRRLGFSPIPVTIETHARFARFPDNGQLCVAQSHCHSQVPREVPLLGGASVVATCAGCDKPPEPQPQPQPQEDPCGKLLWKDGPKAFTLSDGTVIYVIVSRYEKCTKVDFVDRGGKALGGTTPASLPEDFNQKVGAATISGFNLANDGKKIAESGGKDVVRYGEFKVFTVSGCKEVKFVQFIHTTISITVPGQKPESVETLPWQIDGGDPYPGSLRPGAPDNGAMIDGPGVDTQQLPADVLKELPDGTTITNKFELETFICCDGELLGYVSWGFEVTSTVKGGKQSAPKSTISKPVWHDAKDSPRTKDVKCK